MVLSLVGFGGGDSPPVPAISSTPQVEVTTKKKGWFGFGGGSIDLDASAIMFDEKIFYALSDNPALRNIKISVAVVEGLS